MPTDSSLKNKLSLACYTIQDDEILKKLYGLNWLTKYYQEFLFQVNYITPYYQEYIPSKC